jgi:aspartyl-tRNA(Asn)/glutamyl-tRNA(Gln) amidotransferase subunit C
MNSFSLDDVKHVAKLAQLVLTADEEKRFAAQLTSILEFISKLQQIPTKNVEPTSQVTGLTNVFREDEIDGSRMLSQEEALANAKETHNGFFKVRAILAE